MLNKVLLGGTAVLAILVILFVINLAVQGVKSRKGKPLGMSSGQLQTCPNSPNCVNSEYSSDSKHYTEPLVLNPDQAKSALAIATAAIRVLGGEVVAENDAYLAAEFKSSLFGFVDDFELRLDAGKQILHVRSASRVGYGDLGINAKRVAAFREEFARQSGKH